MFPFPISRSDFFQKKFFQKIVARQKINSYLVATSRMASLLPANEKKVSDEHHR
jgi:hypothetical protein